MSQLTNEQIVNIAQSSVDTVATNIDSVKNNSANIAAILAVWTAMSAIKMAPDAAQAAGLSQGACEAIQARCEQILENVQAVTDVVPATPTKLGVCRGDQTTISTMNGILSLMPHHVSHEPGGADVITFLGSVAEKLQALGTISGDVTIDLSAGLSVIATVGGATTLAFANVPAGGTVTVLLRLTNGGAYAVTWGMAPRWGNGIAPVLSESGADYIAFYHAEGEWTGLLVTSNVQ